MDTESFTIHSFKEGDLFDNRYRLVKRAGSGGFADVWKAEDTLRKNRVVALKIYTRLDEESIKQMSEEYDETEYIQHPNLLTGNHFATVGNTPYLEMRYCDGGSMVGRVGRMSNEELRHMLCDIVKGLAYLHKEGIVHQDIKPDNILYDSKHDTYLLADFGISSKTRTCLSKSAKMSNRVFSMTEAYAPPEKFSGNMADIEPDTKGDIFSLGMTLYELATGMLPFTPPMATGREMLYSQGRLQLDYSKIQDIQIRKIVEACTSYRKEDRPTSEELVSMLGESKNEPEKRSSNRKKPTEKINVDSLNKGTYTYRKPTEPIYKSHAEYYSTRAMPYNYRENNNRRLQTKLINKKTRESPLLHLQQTIKNKLSRVSERVKKFFLQWRKSRTLVEYITEIVTCISLIFTVFILFFLYDNVNLRKTFLYFSLVCLWLFFVEKIIVRRKFICNAFGIASLVLLSLLLLNLAVCGFVLLFIDKNSSWADIGIADISMALFFALGSCVCFKTEKYVSGIFAAIFSFMFLLLFLFSL